MRNTFATSSITALLLKKGINNNHNTRVRIGKGIETRRRTGLGRRHTSNGCNGINNSIDTGSIHRMILMIPPAPLHCGRASSSAIFSSLGSLPSFSSISTSSAGDAKSVDTGTDTDDYFEYPIIAHPAVEALKIDIRPRGKLKGRHKHLFIQHKLEMQQQWQKYPRSKKRKAPTSFSVDENLELFDELAIVLCNTGVVPRKELFETYAAACRIHAKFPHMRRMADLAAGHGLLSWFLLALDLDLHSDWKNSTDLDQGKDLGEEQPSKEQIEQSAKRYPSRTVICVDRRMPPSADVIAAAMIERFPQLESRWCYVQADLTTIEPHPSCLLTSVHACGTLTDYLIELAIGGPKDDDAADGDRDGCGGSGAPLAVVPCCHTIQTRKGYRPHHLSGMDVEEVIALVEQRANTIETTLEKQEIQHHVSNHLKNEMVADVVDEVRCRTLKNAGYSLEVAMLPELFTARNRLLLGDVKVLPSASESVTGGMSATTTMDLLGSVEVKHFFQRKAPYRDASTRTSDDVRIPLSDDEESIAHCHSISGRELANKRFIQQIPNHFTPSIVMSIWLTGSSTTAGGIENIRGDNGIDSGRDGASFIRSKDGKDLDDPVDTEKETFLHMLQNIANQCCEQYVPVGIDDTKEDATKDDDSTQITCTVEIMGPIDVQPSTGRRSQRYKFTYAKPEGSALKDIRTAVVSRSTAKRIHDSIRQKAEEEFGDLLR